MNKLLKLRNIVLAVLALLAIAGIVCYLMIGFGTGAQFDGVKRYSATIAAEDFDPQAFDVKQVERDLRQSLGADVDVTLSQNYTTGAYELCISSSPMSYALLIDNAVSMLSEKYPDLGIESFTERSYAAAQTGMATVAAGIVLLICWVLAYISAWIMVGARDGLSLLALAALNSLAVFGLYVLTRMDNFTLLVAASIAAVAATLFFGAPKIAAYERAFRAQSKKDPAVACAGGSSGRDTMIGLLVVLVVVAVAFVSAAIFVGVDTILPFGAVLAVTLLVSFMSTSLALPGMLAARLSK